MAYRWWLMAAVALVLASCSKRKEMLPDTGLGVDASVGIVDAEVGGTDAPVDAPVVDASVDAPMDAAVPATDAGPPTAIHHWSRSIAAIDIVEMAGSDKHLAVLGVFNGDLDLGDGPRTAAGVSDSFIASYSTSEGAFRWSRVLSGPGRVSLFDGDADQNDNIYVVGTFPTSVQVEGGSFYPAVGSTDGILVSYDKDGAFRWAKHLSDAPAYDVAVTPDGEVTIGGTLGSTTDFGGRVLTASADEDTFLARYDSLGTFEWARTVPGFTLDIAVGPSSEVAIGGSFLGSLDFGDGPHDATGEDAMVATYASNGTLRWSVSFAGAGTELVDAVAIDARGYVIAAGSYSEDFTMGGETYDTTIGAAFVGAVDNDGTYAWSRSLVSSDSVSVLDADTDPLGNAYLTGMYWDRVDLGGGIDGDPSTGGSDGFMASYGPDGAYRWSYLFTDSEFVGGTALHVDSGQSVYLAGQFRVQVDLGGGPLFGADGQVFLGSFTQ